MSTPIRTCLVNISTGLVENVAVIGDTLPANCTQSSTPPNGYLWVPSNVAGIGWTYANGVLTGPAPVPPPPPTQYDIDAAAAKAYTKLQTLMGMTPAQVQAWVTTNVTNLAQAQDAITTLAIAVGILARRM